MLNNERQAGTEVDSSTEADVTTSNHSIGNTHVSRSLVHPIIFSAEMVKAILEGTKSQTRRILKNDLPIGSKWWQVYDGELLYRIVDSKTVLTHCKCPYGKVGDILWVRESAYYHKQERSWFYKATDPLTDSIHYGYRWKPSIHMPKEAARIFLKITNIKVERLQDISHEDIRKEGVQLQPGDNLWNKHFGESPAVAFSQSEAFFDELAKSIKDADFKAWQELWIKINGQESWNRNPFVWVIELERTERPKGFC